MRYPIRHFLHWRRQKGRNEHSEEVEEITRKTMANEESTPILPRGFEREYPRRRAYGHSSCPCSFRAASQSAGFRGFTLAGVCIHGGSTGSTPYTYVRRTTMVMAGAVSSLNRHSHSLSEYIHCRGISGDCFGRLRRDLDRK